MMASRKSLAAMVAGVAGALMFWKKRSKAGEESDVSPAESEPEGS